jgi:hypothetical protein
MSQGAPAEWLADPTGRNQLRYWNGSIWTEHVSNNGVQSTDPLEDNSISDTSTPLGFSMNPSDTVVVWEGEKKNLKAAASGGLLVSARYRMTRDAMHFEAGMLSTRAEMIPLWTVIDVDLAQSMTQKARGVGDVLLRLDPSNTKFGQTTVRLESVDDPRRVRDLVLKQANTIRRSVLDHLHDRDVEKRKAGASSINIGSGTTEVSAELRPATDSRAQLIEQLKGLGELRDAGILTDEEFEEQKARFLNGE